MGFLGVFLAANYMRCGSIVPVMVAHVLHDIVAIGMASDIAESGIITGGISFDRDDPPLHQVRVENERPPDETDITKNRRYLNGSCYT